MIKINKLLLIAFISGLSLTGIEISATRLLGPYFGTSSYIWTNIIAIVLTALSIGYFIGGNIADKNPSLKILLRLIFIAGIFLIFTPFTVKIVSGLSLSLVNKLTGNLFLILGSGIAAVILFIIPLVILGMVSPFLIKLASMREKKKIGKISGLIFGISTLGSILGTLLPTIFLIPTIGTRETIMLFATLLIVIGSFSIPQKLIRIFFILVIFTMLIYGSKLSVSRDITTIFETESADNYIKVSGNTQKLKLSFIDMNHASQSIYDKNIFLTGRIVDYLNILPYLTNSDNKKKKVLIIGLAGGTISRVLNHFWGNDVEIDGIEIDNKVISVAKKYFDLENSSLNIINDDGRTFMNTNNKKYDLIINDAYQNGPYIPWTLTTKEFWKIVKGNLNKDGIAVMDVSAVDKCTELYKYIGNTMAYVFPKTFATYIGYGKNILLIGSEANILFKDLVDKVQNPELKIVANNFLNYTEQIKFTDKSKVLRDDSASIESLVNKDYFDYKQSIYCEPEIHP